MTTMSRLLSRAAELERLPGMTPVRLYGFLEREFRDVERDMLSIASRIEGHPKGIHPLWTEHGQPLRPTQIRFQNKKKGDVPHETRPRRAPTQRSEAAPVLPTPRLPVDDRGWERVPSAWLTTLDEDLERISSADISWGDIGRGSPQEGEEPVNDFPTISIPAREISEDDWIDGVGSVLIIQPVKNGVFVTFSNFDSQLYLSDEKVKVRIEDDGEEAECLAL